MSANFSPELHKYSGIKPLKAWIQMTLPQVYDDALSYQELVYKVLYHLNVMIDDLETMGENIDTLKETYEKLEDYVNDYFDNLDVQAQIDDKIDRMTEEGVFDELFQSYVEALQVQIDNILSTDINIDGMVMPLDGSENVTHLGSSSTAAATSTKVVTVDGEFQLTEGAIVFVKFTEGNGVTPFNLNVNSTGSYRVVTDEGTSATSWLWSAGSIVLFVYTDGYWYMITPPAATASIRGTVTLDSSTDSSDTTKAATPAAVKAAYDLAQAAYELATQNEAGEVTTVPQLATARGINGALFNGSANVTNFATCSTAAATDAKVATLSLSTRLTLVEGATVTVYFTYGYTGTYATLNVNNTGAKGIYSYVGDTESTLATWSAGDILTLVYFEDKWIATAHYTKATTETAGIVKLGSAISSTDKTSAATPAMVYEAYKLAFEANDYAQQAIGALETLDTSGSNYKLLKTMTCTSASVGLTFDLSDIDLTQYDELVFVLDISSRTAGVYNLYLEINSVTSTAGLYYLGSEWGESVSVSGSSSYGVRLGYFTQGNNYATYGGEFRLHLPKQQNGFWWEYKGLYLYSESSLGTTRQIGFPSMANELLSGTDLSTIRFRGTTITYGFAAGSSIRMYGIKNS